MTGIRNGGWTVQDSEGHAAKEGPCSEGLILASASNPRGAHSLLFLVILGHKWSPQKSGVGSAVVGIDERQVAWWAQIPAGPY